MKIIVILLFCIIPFGVMAQNKQVNFRTFESWQEVLKKAKEEKKTIFIDAYATWCVPCKKMDVEIFTDFLVVDFINANFIAVKMQVDRVENDSESIKSWYADAAKLQKKYQIQVLPTFLFLDSAGRQIYRGEGYLSAKAFLAFIMKANSPLENYSIKVDKFRNGNLSGDELLFLALQAKKYHDDSLAVKIAYEYKTTIIDRTDVAKLLKPESVDYLTAFGKLITLRDSITKYMLKNANKADSLFGKKGFSQRITDYLIIRDEINPRLRKNNKITDDPVNWDAWEKKLSNEYGSKRTQKLLSGYKTEWYCNRKDWDNYVKYSIEKQEINGIDTSWVGRLELNNLVYEVILKYSDNPVYLNKALDYMRIVIGKDQKSDAQLDTYANVLYRLGKKDEALTIENRALAIAQKRNDAQSVKIFREAIEKMKAGLPVPYVE